MKATTEELNQVFEDVRQIIGVERATAAKGAMFRFLNTTEFYSSPENICKLCQGIANTGGDFTDVQTYRDMFGRLKANNALETEPAPVVVAADPLDADGFTAEERERAKSRRANRAERAIWNMPADEYRKQTPELGRKHAR